MDHSANSLDELRKWIGRQEFAEDIITPELTKRMCATLDLKHDFAIGDIAPLCIHWCLGLPAAATSELGPDGHPKRGGFLPPVPLPRRMWAGGELEFLSPLHVGETIRRTSTIENVTFKTGKSGDLCFVTVRHEVSNGAGTALRERHDIVYRGISARSTPAPLQTSEDSEKPKSQWVRVAEADPALLFRYSALTFNGHRIHYDRDYCINVEKYPGLVFHGPLQATLLAHFAADLRHTPPRIFSFRSRTPIFDGGQITLNAADSQDSFSLWLWTADQAGETAMSATASW